MYPLENKIQPYAWGSRTAIADLLGAPSPSPLPQAELWMGAHPSAPSLARVAGELVPLGDVVARAPEAELGPEVTRAFGTRLPFLVKVLAAETPLSLQAHPTIAQAEAGFAADDAQGIPRDAPNRNYRDRNHKPELICALSPFEALCGFRDIGRTLELLDALRIAPLEPLLGPLRSSRTPEVLRALFLALMQSAKSARRDLVGATLAACANSGPFPNERRWALRLSELYPGDIGVVTMLLLNRVRLEPGGAIFLPAGNLHAYLGGVGVEIMASSDNVLRGGLTPKHIDVPELAKILNFNPGPVPAVTPEQSGVCHTYRTEAREFELSRIDLRSQSSFCADDRRGPEILLVTEGELAVEPARGATAALARGRSAFVSASDGAYVLRGRGQAYRATVGRGFARL
jgi:mannose-6-phosphate isomerase